MIYQKKLVSLIVASAIASMAGCGTGDNNDNGDKKNKDLHAGLTDNTVALSNDNIYVLASGFPGTVIGNGDAADGDATNDDHIQLKIDAGTLILGNAQEALVVTRGSKIEAKGTAANPIVMTSKTQFDNWAAGGDGESGRGEWAGFALMGYAPTNECGTPCDVASEGEIGAYGGDKNDDSSGDIEYVVVRHAGNDIDGQGNELNGLTLFGVGSNTKLSHIQVHKGLDDGIEHFGSSDFMDHVVLTDNQDDSFDWGQGYTGGVQFMVAKQADDKSDRLIEADNDHANPDATPVSQPRLANITLMGSGTNTTSGVLLRRGTGANIHNAVVANTSGICFDIDELATMVRAYDKDASAYTGKLTVENSLVNCATSFVEADQDFDGDGVKDTFASQGYPNVADWFANSGSNNDSAVTANVDAAGIPQGTFAAAVSNKSFTAPADSKFVDTGYAGAYDPAGSNWTAGWTVSLNGNKTVWKPAVTPVADGTCPAGTTLVGAIDLPAAVGGGQMDLCQMDRRYDASDFAN